MEGLGEVLQVLKCEVRSWASNVQGAQFLRFFILSRPTNNEMALSIQGEGGASHVHSLVKIPVSHRHSQSALPA